MKALLFILVLASANSAVCQTTKCISKTDSSDVVRIAKKKHIYWTKNWQCPPSPKLDTTSCEWKLIACKIEHTTKGECKYTNGCTIYTTAILVVNALTGKVVSFEKKKELSHNYE